MLAQGHTILVSDWCCHCCTLLIMLRDKEKAQCVFWFMEIKLLVSDQPKLNEFGRKPQHLDIHHWSEHFKEMWRVCKRKPSERPAVFEENVERIFSSGGTSRVCRNNKRSAASKGRNLCSY